jgi:putative metallohydrolase (TIGR04338 family)
MLNSNGRERDSQRSKVYAAEQRIHLDSPCVALSELREWINDTVVTSRWFHSRWPLGGVIRLKDGRGRRRACAYPIFTNYHLNSNYSQPSPKGGVIKLPRWSRTRIIALHELAHIIIRWHFPYKVAAHGKEFCGVYLQLVKRWMGQEYYLQLRSAFKETGAKYTNANPKRVR